MKLTLQETVNRLAGLLTRYRETDEWNENNRMQKITLIKRAEIEAVERAIELMMGEGE